MSRADHRIGRIRLQLRSKDRAGHTALAAAFTAGFEGQVLPVIAAGLDGVADQSRTVTLDRLHVDIGRIAPTLAALTHALEQALDLALRQALPPAALRPIRAKSQTSDTPNAPLSARAAADAWQLTPALLHYLRTGTLPWPGPGAALTALLAELTGPGAADLAVLLRALLPALSYPAARRRLILQFPERLLARMTLATAGWPLGLADAAAAAPIAPKSGHLLLAPLAQLAARPDDSAAAAALAGALVAALAGATGDAPSHAPETPEPKPLPAASLLPVTAAGGVILHPYLSAYFDALNLLSAPDRFRDRAAQERAVLLAHHLFTGDVAPPEPDCLLAKLLCGLPLSAPIPRATTIGPEVATEADQLLRAVIRHWSRLGATSPDGLREGFLTRPGALSQAENGPHLRVERRSLDVLLDHLPWTISRIRTPFMPKMLTVEWG